MWASGDDQCDSCLPHPGAAVDRLRGVTTPEGIAHGWEADAGPVPPNGGEPAEAGEVSRIEFDLKPLDSRTELMFIHARLKTGGSRSSHERGWAGALDKLARHYHGIRNSIEEHAQ